MSANTRVCIASLLFITLAGGVQVLGCTQDATRPDPPPSSPGLVPAPATSAAPAGLISSPIKVGCEELGNLSATSLSAKLAEGDPPAEATAFTVAGRPVTTKVNVVAVGAPSDLVGKPATLGAGLEQNYATCSHCVVMAIGCGNNCSEATWFFARSGTGAFTAIGTEPGQSFEGRFDNVELEQVTIDGKTNESKPVEHGACLHISSLTFSATTAGTVFSTSSSTSSSSSSSGTAPADAGSADGSVDGGSSGSTSSSSGSTSSSSGSTSSSSGSTSSSSGSSGKGGGGGGGGSDALKTQLSTF